MDKGVIDDTTEESTSTENERFAIGSDGEKRNYDDADVFGHEEGNEIKYKTLSWPLVAVLMTAEIVSNGMLSLPQALAIVGLIPGLILIIFLGVFATYTSYLLVQFKLRHPEVHNMGDAGMILFGPIGRDIFAIGTVVFAICGTGGQLLAGQIALRRLSDARLCSLLYTAIFAAPTLLLSFPRTFARLAYISVPAVISILLAALIAMLGAGIAPSLPSDRLLALTNPSATFFSAFFAVTNPVFAYAGHFMFFALISEMRRPHDAMRAAYATQITATTFYVVFAVVTYVYLGPGVSSPSFESLQGKWRIAAWSIVLPNLLVAGSLYAHTASKTMFVRVFRGTRHLSNNTSLSWTVWIALIVTVNAAAFVLAVGVPIFSYLIGLAASLFASWYTYGIAGLFWLHDAWVDRGGFRGWRERKGLFVVNVLTVAAGAFICVAGMYATVRAIKEAYENGAVGKAFSC